MPELSREDLAARYGWALGVINSSPDLKGIFEKAVAETWAPERFVAEVRNTNWYKTQSEATRQWVVLQKADPSEADERRNKRFYEINNMMGQVGVMHSRETIWALTNQSLMFGWDANQIRATLVKHVNPAKDMTGQAGAYEQQVRGLLRSYGVSTSEQWLGNRMRQLIQGSNTIEGVRSEITRMAQSAFPAYYDELEKGRTMEDIAAPYIQSYAKILEVNPETISVYDDFTLRKTLQAKGQDGKPAVKSLWEFENDLRKDVRWRKTKNAQDQAMSVARQVLTDFGIQA